ncbi:MAG: chromate transporter [Bacteroidales bacterium]|nr:chromate transporter [Candidatus Physcousia equi]
MIFLQLFWTFFKIGLFGFGGGYAMISMIQGDVVNHNHWLTPGQFTDIVAVSQSTPGPIGINSATYVGYSSVVNAGYSPVVGFVGSLIATIAVVLPSFVLMLLISKFLMRYKNHPSVEHTFLGLRPAVVGLLLAASLLLMTSDNFGSPSECFWQFLVSLLLFFFTIVAQGIFKLGAIRIIIISALVGIALL